MDCRLGFFFDKREGAIECFDAFWKEDNGMRRGRIVFFVELRVG